MWWMLAQAETIAVEKVLEAIQQHQKTNGNIGFDSYLFLCSFVIVLTVLLAAVKWLITNHQTAVREITKDHKEACETLTETFSETTSKLTESFSSTASKMRGMVHDARDIAMTVVTTKEAADALRKSRDQE